MKPRGVHIALDGEVAGSICSRVTSCNGFAVNDSALLFATMFG